MSSYIKYIGAVAVPAIGWMVSETLGSAVRIVMNDSATSKLVGGGGCVLAGGYVIAKSRIMTALYNKVCNHPQDRAIKLNACRTSIAVTGALIMAYGLWQCASGITELWQRNFSIEDSSKEADAFSPAYPTRELPGDRQIVEELTNKLRKCPEVDTLWKQVEEDGKFSIRLGTEDEIPSYANWDPLARTISVRRDLEPENHKLAHTLFELCNGKYFTAKLSEIGAQAIAGDLSRDDYHKKIVQAEWFSARCDHAIAKKCVNSQGWDWWVDLFRDKFSGPNPTWKTFESMWQDYIQDDSQKAHRDAITAQWNYGAKEAYCEKHPLAKDCTTL